MAQVDSENSIAMPAPESAQDSFISLAAAVSPAWHQAIIRLANVSEKVASKLGWVLEHDQDNGPASVYVKNCRELVDLLLDLLNGLEEDPDLEPTLGFMNGPSVMDECETPEDGEPSLASLDRMTDQTKWAKGSMSDAELDESDDEPSLGSLSSHGHGDQSVWGRAGEGVVDAEDEHDGREPCQDEEPSLGSTATINQEAWAFGNNADREQGTTRRFREERKLASICNVTPVSGEWWKLEKVD
jgi:hypothetical protein